MIITQTPMRVSLLGGNTDYPRYFKKHGGAVLTMAINVYVYCIVKERFDKEIWVNYSKKEKVKDVNKIKHDLVRECLRFTGVKEGVEITFLSDIPGSGSGLGSSSAVTVGLLNALHRYKGDTVGAKQLAEEACRIEINILKKPIGVQDQYAVAFGGMNHINMGKDIKVYPFASLDIEKNLMLLYTGKTRDANKVLSKMKLVKKILDKNKRLALSGGVALVINDKKKFGEILDEYWNLKKKLNKHVSSSWFDKKYEKALNAGAWGGKIVGAGSGGFFLFCLPHDRREAVKKSLNLRELPFGVSKDGSKIIFDIRK